jgi:hypothetical protein
MSALGDKPGNTTYPAALTEPFFWTAAHTGIWFATHADVVRYVKQGS